MRTKKIALNMLGDILPYILIGVVGLVKMNVLITYIGDVGNGYYQFINQIIAYVFLAQAGFSDAVIYRLYKSFANDDKNDINSVYSGARSIFKKIGYIILGIIFVVTIGLYLFYGFQDGYRNTVLLCFVLISCSYLISYFGKTQTYGAVLAAAQEKYIYSLVFNFVKLIDDICIVLIVVLFKNLESVAVVIVVSKIIEEIIMRIVVKKKYPWLHEVSKKETGMVKMIKDLAWVQVGYLVLNNIDAILLMFFIGPVIVSIYTTYNYILRYLNEISSRVELAAVSSFGNVFAKKEDNKITNMFNQFFVLFIILGFSISLTFMLGIRSFVMVWIKDSSYILSYFTVFLFTSTLFLNIIYYPLLAVINANGLFKDNKKHIFICASINLILSTILINFYGINGILLATAIAFLVNIFLKTKLITKKTIINYKHIDLLKKYILAIILFVGFSFIFRDLELFFFNSISGFISCILALAITFILMLIITFGTLYLADDNAKGLLDRVINLIKRKRKN